MTLRGHISCKIFTSANYKLSFHIFFLPLQLFYPSNPFHFHPFFLIRPLLEIYYVLMVHQKSFHSPAQIKGSSPGMHKFNIKFLRRVVGLKVKRWHKYAFGQCSRRSVFWRQGTSMSLRCDSEMGVFHCLNLYIGDEREP